MKLNEIRDNRGATQARKRVGRGIGSGLGKTSGRGGKGQTARSGVSLNGFEGGQTPLYRRLPKRGFNNVFAREFQEINLDRLQAAIDAKRIATDAPITAARLVEGGILRRAFDGIRLLGDGKDKFNAKITIEVAGASKSAIEAVEKAGGKVIVLPAIRESVLKDSAARKERRAKRAAKNAKPSGKPAEKPAS
ncbi:MAG TPA: 50S ribosomal protein L15 [Alphaproteobacteria bacterium]|nr:50S ribosomal protein L15 [Alphaproteobacteria bacterium]